MPAIDVDRLAVELDYQPVADGAHQMQMHFLIAVRGDVQLVGRRQCRDIHEFGDAAQDLRIGVVDRGGVMGDEIAEAVTRIFVLAGGDGDGSGASQQAVPAIIIGGQRLLEPIDIVWRHAFGDLNGFAQAVSAVGVDHQLDPVADRLARDADAFDIFAYRRPADLHLDRFSAQLEVGLHFRRQTG